MLQIGGQMAQKPTFIPNCAILGYNYYCSKHKLYCLYDTLIPQHYYKYNFLST